MENREETLYCVGCGAQIQTDRERERGYTPRSVLNKSLADPDLPLYCQRCFKLRHYNQLQNVQTSADEFLAILHEIGDQDGLIVNVLDIFDIAGSLIPGLQRFVGNRDIVFVANKVDLLPKSTNQAKLLSWLKTYLSDQGFKAKHVLLTSAKKKQDIDQLLDLMEDLRQGQDVYLVGATNVGKSSLVNAILKATGYDYDLITTSNFPGTTLDTIEIPFADQGKLVDTPGVIQPGQMTSLLDSHGLKQVMPKNEIKARTYQLNSEQTLFIGGLAQLDYLAGERNQLTVYAANSLDIHRRKLAGSQAFYEKHAGSLLTPTAQVENPVANRVRREFHVKPGQDIVVSGLAWIKVGQAGDFALHVPKGIDVTIRSAII
ncbi:ribosome biogenesis GTPase YqeH [Aerococcus urinaehominis]|uniref:Ribosome biogenesis GTPase YqeH n=1 Tax=Aerococcus urinaehominis TaxID=128944 RepID=A0A0X8FLS5_9LACT|nr:ribosome biogenesis GTPase YqeH [Aerococcus urinaehominis]AMB99645.1 ribosome biogenesis GTPase YqeH [Aerococcus urinaehominis]SDL88775.1 hypothetical protein SAMN04487985_10293 [Aerococcus urinaehominis]